MFLLLSLRSDFDLAKVEATSSNLVTRPQAQLNQSLKNQEPLDLRNLFKFEAMGLIMFSFPLNPSKKFTTFGSKMVSKFKKDEEKWLTKSIRCYT